MTRPGLRLAAPKLRAKAGSSPLQTRRYYQTRNVRAPGPIFSNGPGVGREELRRWPR